MQLWSKCIDKFYEFFFVNMWIGKCTSVNMILGMYFRKCSPLICFFFFLLRLPEHEQATIHFFMSTKNKGKQIRRKYLRRRKKKQNSHGDEFTHAHYALALDWYSIIIISGHFCTIGENNKSFGYLSTSTVIINNNNNNDYNDRRRKNFSFSDSQQSNCWFKCKSALDFNTIFISIINQSRSLLLTVLKWLKHLLFTWLFWLK